MIALYNNRFEKGCIKILQYLDFLIQLFAQFDVLTNLSIFMFSALSDWKKIRTNCKCIVVINSFQQY